MSVRYLKVTFQANKWITSFKPSFSDVTSSLFVVLVSSLNRDWLSLFSEQSPVAQAHPLISRRESLVSF